MSTNIDREKILDELTSMYPRMRKPEKIRSAILAALDLNATTRTNAKTKWQLEKAGAEPNSVYAACRKYRVLERYTVPRVPIPRYGRGKAPRNDSEWRIALERERPQLYKHLQDDKRARDLTIYVLGLPEGSTVSAIEKDMESGTIQQQIRLYDIVVSRLEAKKLYNKYYDYRWMGFRFRPDRYWLSSIGMNIMRKAIR
ncbi:MAG: hypothetical protein HMLIMOIP_000688 [Candidatus Nitrosomirales archaeon]|jgi:hypothetical protein